jgi:predicted ester cyclase
MNLHRRSHAPRIFLLFAFALLLTLTHLPSGSAQVVPEQVGRTYLGVIQGTSPLASSMAVSPTAVLHTPEGIYHGGDGVEEFSSYLQDSFSDLSFVVRDSSVSGSDIVVHFVMVGTHTGSYHGMPGNCAGIKVPGVAVLTSDDHGISEQWISYDQDTLEAQIDGFHQLDPTNKPDCPQIYPDEPVRDPVCIRRDRCDANY